MLRNARTMVFVDGENLAIRYRAALDGRPLPSHVQYDPDVLVWSPYANIPPAVVEVVRTYYYTSVGQDEPRRREVEDRLKGLGIGAPRVFPKEKGKRSKRVDISLATDMLSHAHRGHYDVAILVAGDEDYVPLVQAVMAEGRRVVVWFFANGLSRDLRLAADHYYDIGGILLTASDQLTYVHM